MDNSENNGYKGSLPIEDDPLFFWRLAEELSVIDAAILISGNDPSETEIVYDSMEGMARYEQDGSYMKRQRRDHPGFAAAFSGLKNAVLKGRIPAQFGYPSQYLGHHTPHFEPNFIVVSKQEIDKILLPDDPFLSMHGALKVYQLPDWEATTVKVDDVKEWLKSRGFTAGFFFSGSSPDPDEFMNKSHDHFAPELAMAISAWRALAERQNFPRSPKAAIEDWIDANPSRWNGDEALSNEAKKRIMTLVNWKRSGGANPTGG